MLRILLCCALGLVLAAAPGEISLNDGTAAARLVFEHHNSPTKQKYLPETMGAGVAVIDFNNDGRPDLFFTNGAKLDDPMPAGKRPDKSAETYWNRLYRQNGDGTFTDVTRSAGVSGAAGVYHMGVAVGDFDNDGFEDLYVTGYDHATLYRNNGNGTFTDVTARAHVEAPGWSTSALFFDFDNDGKLDILVTRYMQWSFEKSPSCGGVKLPAYCHPRMFPGASSILYRNSGDGIFTDVTQKAGLGRTDGKGLGVAVADYDNDGWMDIYIANDSVQAFLFHNQHDGTFKDVSLASGVAYNENGVSPAGMGVDFADYDNDGYPDIVVTDLSTEMYMLFRNHRDGTFSDATIASGIGRSTLPYSGWGVKFGDFDNDGWKDLFVAQGHVMDTIEMETPTLRYKQPPLWLQNRSGKFVPFAKQHSQPWAGRGAAVADFDSDGGLDVVVANLGERAYLLRNEGGNRNAWLGLKLEGRRSNRDAIGARVKVIAAGLPDQYYTVNPGGSYLSASDRRLLIGLGGATEARVEIRWPSGKMQTLEHLTLRRYLDVKEPE